MSGLDAVSSIRRALSFILKDSKSVALYDYSHAGDFQNLWSLRIDRESRILVVWSHTARDCDLNPIDVSESLSPVDWAAVFAKQCGSDPQEWPEVMILDCQPTLHRNVPSVEYLSSLKSDQLPWLRIETDFRVATIVDWLKRTDPRDIPKCRLAVDLFLRRMRLELTSTPSRGPYDRHAISNIMGPMILRGKATRETLHSSALLRLLSASDLIQAEGVPLAQDNRDETDSAVGTGLQLLLIDDQADHGWTDWVRESVPHAIVSPSTDPTDLVLDLRRQLEQSGRADLRYRFQPLGVREGKLPVLLLDLRLFSGSADREQTFLKETLLPIVERFTDRDDLAWPAFSTAENRFVAALDAIKRGALELESSEYHEVLTWLPRVVALADPSLPIILFSSTGRRSIERVLSSYQNVILGFEKPRVFDSADGSHDIAFSARTRLLRAIDDAATVLAGRTQARQALLCAPRLAESQLANRFEHLELYMDERYSDGDLVMGGLIAGFASIRDADEFEDQLVYAGVRYFPTVAGPIPSRSGFRKKNYNCKREFEKVVTSWKTQGKPLLLGIVTMPVDDPHGQKHLAPMFMDNRWRWGVETMVEVFLSQIVAPFLRAGKNSSVSIFGATRWSKAKSESQAREYESRFGIRAQEIKNIWGNNAVAESGMFNLATRVMRDRSLNLRLHKTKFARLKYDGAQCLEWEVPGGRASHILREKENANTLQDLYPGLKLQAWRAGLRSLHYVCDQVLRDVVPNKGSLPVEWSSFGRTLPTAHERLNRKLERNLLASRFLDQGLGMEALAEWRVPAGTQPEWRNGIPQISEAIGAHLAEVLETLPGISLAEASRRLRRAKR